jgi:hypothetical protein
LSSRCFGKSTIFAEVMLRLQPVCIEKRKRMVEGATHMKLFRLEQNSNFALIMQNKAVL